MGVGFIGRKTDGTEAGEREAGRRIILTAVNDSRQRALKWEIVFGAVALEAIGIADIGDGHHSLSAEGVLYAKAPLVTGRQFVRFPVQTGDAVRFDRQSSGCARFQGEPGIIHFDWPGSTDLQAERNVRAGVVHVVTLNALVHDAATAANNGLATAGDVISEPDTRTERSPVIVYQALWYAVLAGNTNSVQIERNASENRVRTEAQTWASGCAARVGRPAADGTAGVEGRRLCRIVEIGVEVTHTVVGFVSVWNAIPAQAKVEGQPAIHAPVVLNVGSPRYVVPQAMVLHSKFLIRLGISEEEVSKVVTSKGPVKVESTLRLTEQILNLLVDRPAKSELELVGSLGPREIVANLVVVGFVSPRPTGNLELRAGGPLQVNIGYAVQIVWPCEQSRIGRVVSTGKRQALQTRARNRNDIDAVAVVVERDLVEKSWADAIRRVDDSAVGRIAEGVADGRNVSTAPLADRGALRDLLSDEVAESGAAAGEVVIDADDLFLQVRGSANAAEKLHQQVLRIRPLRR